MLVDGVPDRAPPSIGRSLDSREVREVTLRQTSRAAAIHRPVDALDLERRELPLAREPRAQLRTEIGHLLRVLDPAPVLPCRDLVGAVRALAGFGEPLAQALDRMVLDVEGLRHEGAG